MTVATPTAAMQEAALLLERRRTAQARALLQTAIAANPGHPGLLLKCAQVEFLDEHYGAAARLLEQVLMAEPASAGARGLLFAVQSELGQLRQAEETILGLLRDFPESAEYYGDYAMLMLRAMNLGKASALAREGLRHDSECTECLAALVLCELIQHGDSRPSASLQQLLVREPEHRRTLGLLIASLEQRGQLQAARRLARELLRAYPADRDVVELARHLTYAAHWSLRPLWPMQRWGWGGSFAIWIGAIVLLRVVEQAYPPATFPFVVLLVGYVAYSWAWPPLLRRLLR